MVTVTICCVFLLGSHSPLLGCKQWGMWGNLVTWILFHLVAWNADVSISKLVCKLQQEEGWQRRMCIFGILDAQVHPCKPDPLWLLTFDSFSLQLSHKHWNTFMVLWLQKDIYRHVGPEGKNQFSFFGVLEIPLQWRERTFNPFWVRCDLVRLLSSSTARGVSGACRKDDRAVGWHCHFLAILCSQSKDMVQLSWCGSAVKVRAHCIGKRYPPSCTGW